MDQIVDERGDEDGFAGTGEARDAEADIGPGETDGALGESGKRDARLVGDVGEVQIAFPLGSLPGM
jgi:hypothetical protein